MNKSSFEKIIAEQGKLIYSNEGNSMYPMIQPRDLLVIEKISAPLKKDDIPLYKRESGQYVLHRIIEIRSDGFVTRGDNRAEPEFGVTKKTNYRYTDRHYQRRKNHSGRRPYTQTQA